MGPTIIEFSAVPTSATLARCKAATFACAHGFCGDDLSDIETSVGEAVANAIEHGNRQQGRFSLSLAFTGGVLTIEVHDGGTGFDEANAPEPVSERRLPTIRGYGIHVMRTLMNRVTFRNGGATVVLEKRRSG